VIDAERKKQMAAPGLQEPARKALATMDREWDGLIAHRGYPLISLDNNIAERQIRGPVVTRKNVGGSRNGGTARNAARVWTVTATVGKAGLNLQTYLAAYLDECGRNNGKPRTVPRWNASCRGPRVRKTSGHRPTRPRLRKLPPEMTRSPAWPTATATPTIGMPFHRASEYLRSNPAVVRPPQRRRSWSRDGSLAITPSPTTKRYKPLSAPSSRVLSGWPSSSRLTPGPIRTTGTGWPGSRGSPMSIQLAAVRPHT
jgi:Transposase IS66 family